LQEAVAWLRREDPSAARRLRDAILAGARLLGHQPLLGRPRPELAPLPLRILVVSRFPSVLAYDVLEDGRPVIQRVLHTSRDIPSLFRSADD
jgi:plasmid stabilization system protein ParE